MTITQQSDQERVYQMFLSYDDTVHSGHEIRHKCTLLFYPDIQLTDINSFCHNILCLFVFLLILLSYVSVAES